MQLSLEQIVVLFGFLTLIILLFIIYLLLSNRKNNSLNSLLMNLLNNLKNDVQQANIQNKQELQARLDHIVQHIAEYQKNTSQQLGKQYNSNTNLVKDISTQLVEIQHTNEQILGFTNKIQSLERILQQPKQRGILGEYMLETLLANILPTTQYKMQYRFKSQQIVDAAIFFRDKIIPIDAKFPLSNYNKMAETMDKQQLLQLEKSFRNDVKKRIDETAKYIKPAENTTTFAFMFIPAEGVYHFLINQQVGSKDLMDYAFKQGVIMTSPASFYAYLMTVLQGLKALEIEDSVKEVIKKVDLLHQHLQNYEQQMTRLGKQLQTVQNTYKQADAEFRKIEKDLFSLVKGQKKKS